MTLNSKLEALLFVAGKPLTAKKLAELVDAKEGEVTEVLQVLQKDYADRQSGLQIFCTGKQWQMGTAGENAEVIAAFIREEFSGELTRPQLETLTVVAYRGPIGKSELEIIRGVNCSLILRNLMIRGLVDEEYDSARKEHKYRVSIEFLRHLGLRSTAELPDYAVLHGHEVMTTLLAQQVSQSQ